MKEHYIFGIMLEKVTLTISPEEVWDGHKWRTVNHYWRVFSGRLHGPLMFTRRSAFFAWLKNWITDCVRTKRRHIAD